MSELLVGHYWNFPTLTCNVGFSNHGPRAKSSQGLVFWVLFSILFILLVKKYFILF